MTIKGDIETGDIQIQQRANPLRREPPVPDSYLEYEVVGEDGAPLDAESFEVSVDFSGRNEAYDYTFTTRAVEPGRLLVLAPDPIFPAIIRIRAQNEAYTSQPLEITSQEYWREMACTANCRRLYPGTAVLCPAHRRGGDVFPPEELNRDC
jgi:hypothetical protein